MVEGNTAFPQGLDDGDPVAPCLVKDVRRSRSIR